MNRLFLLLYTEGILLYFAMLNGNAIFSLAFVVLLLLGVLLYGTQEKCFLIISMLFFTVMILQIMWIPKHADQRVENDKKEWTGRIVSFVQVREDQVQFVLEDLEDNNRIQCFADPAGWDRNLNFGDEIRWTGQLEKPDGIRNPGGFDYRNYLLAKKIGWVFYGSEQPTLVSSGENGPIIRWLVKMRTFFIRMLEEKLGPSNGAFAKGLLFGEKGMEGSETDLFSRVGISHVLAVSGLHIGILYAFLSGILHRLSVPGPVMMILLGSFFLAYGFWCGFSVSVVRAGGMAMLHLLARCRKHHYDSLNAMSFIGCLSMMFNPYIIATASFQLSYGAVFAIQLFHGVLVQFVGNKRGRLAKVVSPVLLSGAVFCVSIPMVTELFHQIPLLSVWINVLVVPLASLALILLLLSCLMGWVGMELIAGWGFFGADLLIHWIFQIAAFVGKLPFHSCTAPSMPIWGMLVHYLWLLLLCGYIYINPCWKKRLAFLLFLMMIWVPVFEDVLDSTMEVVFLDVGQGDGIIAKIPGGKIVLVDGGGNPYRKVGEEVVLQALLHSGIDKVDVMVCTHSHEDHSLGLWELMDDVEVSMIVINSLEQESAYGDLVAKANQLKIPVVKVHAGMELDLGKEVRMKFLYPMAGQTYTDSNNSSLVAQIVYGETAFLLTGDVERLGEETMLHSGEYLKSHVMKIAHHGSNTSSVPEFIKKADPDFAVISVGEKNRYGHPGDKTLELLESEGVQYYRTDRHGAVIFTSDGIKIQGRSLVKEQE